MTRDPKSESADSLAANRKSTIDEHIEEMERASKEIQARLESAAGHMRELAALMRKRGR